MILHGLRSSVAGLESYRVDQRAEVEAWVLQVEMAEDARRGRDEKRASLHLQEGVHSGGTLQRFGKLGEEPSKASSGVASGSSYPAPQMERNALRDPSSRAKVSRSVTAFCSAATRTFCLASSKGRLGLVRLPFSMARRSRSVA